MSPNVPAILGVLRHAAIAGRGVLLLSDVEALEEAIMERASLRLALADMFKLLDENILVRNLENEGAQDWHLKMLDLVVRLKAAQESLEKAGTP